MTHPPSAPFPPNPFPPQRPHGTATAALVLGVIGLTVVPGVGIVAWILGAKALEEIDSHPEAGWTNRDHANIGRILGIVGTLVFVAIILFFVCYFAFIFALVANSTP